MLASILARPPKNVEAVTAAAPYACGLKIYVNSTFGTLRLTDWSLIEAHIAAWSGERPIVVHCEGPLIPQMLRLGERYGRHIHVAHVARREEIEAIVEAKLRGVQVSCEASPHHLILSTDDLPRLGPFGDVRPLIATPDDRAALWEHIDAIDCFATDHAPHTIVEKRSDDPPPGLPGVQTMLPLMLTAVDDGRITLEQLTERMAYNPARLFGIGLDSSTSVEVEIGPRWTISNEEQLTSCGWTPFDGMEVTGRVLRTVLRGNSRLGWRPGAGSTGQRSCAVHGYQRVSNQATIYPLNDPHQQGV